MNSSEKSIEIECFKADHQPLVNFLPKNRLRRTDHFSQLSLLATFLALKNCNLTPDDIAGDETGIIIATGYGATGSTCSFKDSIFESGDIGPSPIMFTKSVHNQASSHLAIQLGITGPNLTISQHYLSFHAALQTACIWLEENRVKRIIVGGVDEFGDILGYSRHRFLHVQCQENDCPALQNKNNIPGEGAGFFIVEKRAHRGAPTIELPIIGKRDKNDLYQHFAADRTIYYDNTNVTTPAESCSKNNLSQSENPRRLYGEFPTAPAIDFGYAIATATKGQSISCTQITSENHFGTIKINP